MIRPQRIRNELMFKLLATTEMRRQELVDLTWGQVNVENKTILGRKGTSPPFFSMPYRFQDYKKTLLDQQKHYIVNLL